MPNTPIEILKESQKSYKDYCEKVAMELVDPSEYFKDLTIKLLESEILRLKDSKPGYIQSWHDAKADRAELDGYNNAINDSIKYLEEQLNAIKNEKERN